MHAPKGFPLNFVVRRCLIQLLPLVGQVKGSGAAVTEPDLRIAQGYGWRLPILKMVGQNCSISSRVDRSSTAHNVLNRRGVGLQKSRWQAQVFVGRLAYIA